MGVMQFVHQSGRNWMLQSRQGDSVGRKVGNRGMFVRRWAKLFGNEQTRITG